MASASSPRHYKPGALIHRENAFVRVLSRKMKEEYCDSCCKRSVTLRACTECLAVNYCSKSCQEADKLDHLMECKYMNNLPKCFLEDTVRLLGKVVLKIKGKDWKKITTNVLGKEVSFEDIDPCLEKITEDPIEKLHFIELKGLLKRYIGDDNMPDENELLKIIGKVTNHKHGASTTDSSPLTYCFFLGSSSFHHECIPNANIEVIHHKTFKVWANKRINMETDKISITFRSVLFLPPKQFSDCKCSDCSLPYGESILTKILDESRAYSVISVTERFLQLIECEPIIPMISDLKEMANEFLHDQKGVLGDTNALRLRILAFKSITLPGSPSEKIAELEKLESYMSSIFGEYYLEMEPIYTGLMAMNVQLGKVRESRRYLAKIKQLQIHRED